jgi:NADH-quinone oxidoreductase subunit C
MENLTTQKVQEKFPEAIINIDEFRGDFSIVIKKEYLIPICEFLKADTELDYNFLTDVAAVDFLERNPRFEVVYHLFSLKYYHRIRLKVQVNENEDVPSLTFLWDTANWMEREIYDMFGIKFSNHPDLRRILMPEEYEGHPLRKDFPFTKEEIMFSFNKDRGLKIE